MKQFLLPLIMLTACAPAGDEMDPGRAVVEAHIAGFNSRDIDAMRAVQHPDAEWLAVSGSEISLITDDRDAWNDIMVQTWTAEPELRGDLRNWVVAGDRIAVTEVALTPDGARETLTAYQIEEGLIRRVWYFMVAE